MPAAPSSWESKKLKSAELVTLHFLALTGTITACPQTKFRISFSVLIYPRAFFKPCCLGFDTSTSQVFGEPRVREFRNS